MDDSLIDRIYEAAVVPELWVPLLGELTIVGNGYFTALFSLVDGDMRWVASRDGVRIGNEYIAEGWPQRTDRMKRLLDARHAGFLVDLDVYTLEEMDREPVFTEFHRPRGLGWGTATAIEVPTGEMFVFDIERRFEIGPVERDTVARLDTLRPHLARASLLSARLAFERARAAAMALEHVGLPAAVISRQMRIAAVNPKLEALMPRVVQDGRARIALAHRQSDALLATALAGLGKSEGNASVRSVPIPAQQDDPPYIVHVLPIRRGAQDIFSNAAAILIVTPVVPRNVPNAEVLQGLFDLTPAEARVARAVAGQSALEAIAQNLGVSRETVRTQLKAVLAKTGVARQGELIGLLSGLTVEDDR
jgi:DNA-binding CsgD family transcriptional regulator